MAWIHVIDDTEATGQLKEIYEEISEKRGKISNIMKIHSLRPDVMESHMDLYLALMFGSSSLKREECELIAVVVSTINQCEYCKRRHAKALDNYWKNNEKVQKVVQDFKSVFLPKKIYRMLVYVSKLTKTPHEINEGDINILHDSGFSDSDILDINLITSYFCFVNRIALGLGVELTSEEVEGYKY